MSNVYDAWAVVWTDAKGNHKRKKVYDLVEALNFLAGNHIPRPFYVINLEDKGEEASLKFDFEWAFADEDEVLDLLERATTE